MASDLDAQPIAGELISPQWGEGVLRVHLENTMKNVKNIYVGGMLELGSGRRVAAMRPVAKGEKNSMALTTDGTVVLIAGHRINGVGIKKFLLDRGFRLATEQDEVAVRLADRIAVSDGVALIETLGAEHAKRLQQALGGQDCMFVPFKADQPVVPVRVSSPRGLASIRLALGTGFAAPSLQCDYLPELGFKQMSADLSEGWVIAREQDAAQLPRATEYGGLVETAVFVLASCGIGVIEGSRNLLPDETDPFPCGRMVMRLANGDAIIIGIDGCDTLIVQYERDGSVICQRSGLTQVGKHLNLGGAIGSIAAVLVMVAEADAGGQSKAA